MAKILLGLTLILASTLTAWALFAEGYTIVIPALAAVLYLGVRCIRNGIHALAAWSEFRVEVD